MNKSFIVLSFLMGIIVLLSNYLVQFPVNYYGLNEILTYGAFSYPVAFLITDLANRSFGKVIARKIVYLGFLIGIGFTILFSTDFANLISIRIAIGSGVAFLIANFLMFKYSTNLEKKNGLLHPLLHQYLAQQLIHFYFSQYLFMQQECHGSHFLWEI